MDSNQKSQTKIQLSNSQQITQANQMKDIDDLVVKILAYRNKANGRLYEAINQDFLLNLLDKSKIIEIEKSFPSKGLDIIDFVRLFLNNIPHREDEILYLTISLIELFKRISESLNLSTTIKMKHITSIICDQSLYQFYLDDSFIQFLDPFHIQQQRMQEKNSAQYKIQTVLMPEPQKFKLDQSKIRSIDIDPPPIYGRYDDDLQRLVKQKIKTDSMHHLNHRIKTGVYAKDIKRIISLDSLSDKINMYSIDCEFKQSIRPKSNSPTEKISSDIIIFSFAWSERQERLGATLKDFSLCFWDRSDNFKYEKQISIQSFMSDYQTNIWYLEFPNCWVTTDAKNQLYEWDLEKELVKRTLGSPKIKHTIFEVVEIPELKLVAIGSSDRLVTIWDFNKGSMVQCIEFFKAGIHSLVYFKSYQVLVCGGFQNNISLHQLDPKFLDVNNKGLLIGHQSMITAIDCVEKTPMIISSDDSGTIKIWDIRTLKCIQTVDCGQRTVISKIINIYPKGKLCFLGTRINVIDFDEADLIVKKSIQRDDAFPIKVENSPNQMIVVTRKDIRFIDIDSGKIKQIFVGLLNDAEDEITAFKQIEQGSKFILGNHRGEISLHNIQNGELIHKLNSHQNEVTSIRIDYLNKLLISGGWDSNIKIQHLTDNGSIMKREIVNCFFNKEVTIIEVSVYHNLLFAASNSENIYVFDYEFAKLLYCIELENKVEVQAMSVVNGFSLLFISANNGFIYIMNFTKKEYLFSAKLIGYIDIPQLITYHKSDGKEEFIPGNLSVNVAVNEPHSQDSMPIAAHSSLPFPQQTSKNILSSLPMRSQKNVFDFNYTNSPLSQSPSQFHHININQSAFANSTAKIIAANRFLLPQVSQFQFQPSLASHDKNQLSSQRSNQQEEQQQQQQSQGEGTTEEQKDENKNKEQNKKVIFVNKILIDCLVNDTIPHTQESQRDNRPQSIDKIQQNSNTTSPQQQRLTKLHLYCSLNKGDILGLNLLPFYDQFDNIIYTEHCNSRINYNAYRGNVENFLKSIEQIKNEKISFSGQLKLHFEGRKCNEKQLNATIYKNIKFFKQGAHKDILTSLKMINLKEQYLLTSSMDCFIKVWNKDNGDLKASLNINHPLPLVWNIEKDILQDGKKKIIFALKILDVIYKKYGKDLSFQEQRKVKVTDFLASIVQSQIDSDNFTTVNNEKRVEMYEQLKKIPITDWISKLVDPKEYKGEVLLMKDQYSPRDLKYEKSKQFFQSELTGPSLKRMEANKRVAMATKAWKQENESKEAELENQLRNENHLLKNYKYEEREEIVQFLEPSYREKLLGNEFSKLQEDFSKGTQDFQRKLDIHLLQKKHLQMIQAQMGSSTQSDIFKKRNTKFLSNQITPQSQTNLQNLQIQPKLSHQNDKLSSINIQDQSDNNEIGQNAFISKRRQDGQFTMPKNMKDIMEEKEMKMKKRQKAKKFMNQSQPATAADFYHYAQEKNLMEQKPEFLNQQQMNQFSQNSIGNPEVQTKSMQQQNTTLNNTIVNQSSIFPTNLNQSQAEITIIQENSQINDQNQNSQANIHSYNKNNSTTIGPISTVLNTSQDEPSTSNVKQIQQKKSTHKISKLSQVLKSMDSKIKRSQQNFNDDSIMLEFLQKRKEMSLFSNQNDVSIISLKKDKDQQGRLSMNSSTILPQIKVTDQSTINGNSQLVTENNSMMFRDLAVNQNSLTKQQQSYQKYKQQQKQSQVLTQNGLEVLKKVLYDIPAQTKQQHYIPSSLKNSKSIRSNVNKSTPHLFTYQMNQISIQNNHNNTNMNSSQLPPSKQISLENENILSKIQESINPRTIMAQKLAQYKNTLNSNIQNAFDLYQHIEDSLANTTPMHIIQHKNKQ